MLTPTLSSSSLPWKWYCTLCSDTDSYAKDIPWYLARSGLQGAGGIVLWKYLRPSSPSNMPDKRLAKVGHGLAKSLGIKLQYRDELNNDALTRGESVFSVTTADTYVESEPTTWEWIRDIVPTGRGILRYLYSLFPFVHWIGNYNLQWFAGDMIAGKH